MPTTALSIITGLVPGLGIEVTDYISGIFDDTSSDDDTSSEDSEESLREFVRPLLEGEGVEEEEIDAAIEQIASLRASTNSRHGTHNGRGFGISQARRLEKAIDMKSNPALSFTATLNNGPVDIESTTKSRNTQVDLKKLEKAETKIKAKMEKRSRRTVQFEGSKLVDAAKAQKA